MKSTNTICDNSQLDGGWIVDSNAFSRDPDLTNAMKLPNEHRAELRRMLSANFKKHEILLAQQQLFENEIDDLNSPWLIDPDEALHLIQGRQA